MKKKHFEIPASQLYQSSIFLIKLLPVSILSSTIKRSKYQNMGASKKILMKNNKAMKKLQEVNEARKQLRSALVEIFLNMNIDETKKNLLIRL